MTDPEIPEGSQVMKITDSNGNLCGFLFGQNDPPWPLIDMIRKEVPTTGYNGSNYKIREL